METFFGRMLIVLGSLIGLAYNILDGAMSSAPEMKGLYHRPVEASIVLGFAGLLIAGGVYLLWRVNSR
jgi:hypothetical protein